MIKQDKSMNSKVIGCIIACMSELNKGNWSSDNDPMLDQQERKREDLSGDSNTNLYGDIGIYKDAEPWDISH